MKQKGYIFLLILVLVVTACEEPVNWQFPPDSQSILAVDGIITNERKAHSVFLTRTINKPDEAVIPVTGAFVAITDFDNTWILPESSETPGLYLTPPDVQGVNNKNYLLYINDNGIEYTAEASMVPVTPLEPVDIRPSGDGDSLFILFPAESDIPAMKEYLSLIHI